MARNNRTAADVRREIADEREQLADAVGELRKGIGDVTDVTGKVRSNLPVAAAGALGAGFFLAGGIGATMRWLARHGREGREKASVGPFAFIDRR
jgi:hypothetical protein